jgi:IQ calmodulin-binding motif
MTIFPSLTLQCSCLQQLIGDGKEFSSLNAELLLAFAEIEVDDVVFHSIRGQLTPSRFGKKVENNDEPITLDFDQWLISIINNARRRLMTCALGSKYGHTAPTYLDRIDHIDSVNFSCGPNSARSAGGGKEQINNFVIRTTRGHAKDGVALREGSSNRASPLKSNDRGLDFTSSYFLKTFSSTMDAPTLGSDSGSYGEDGDGDGDTYEAGQLGNTNGRSDVGVVDDVHSMFDDQDQGTGSRPTSPIRRHTMTNEFKKNLKSDWSRIVASRSATSMAYPSMALKGPLAPVRAQQVKSKAAQKRMLLNNGFNESFGRATPRCLKNDQLGQASSFNGISSTGMLDGYRSFGGAAKDVEVPLTDAKSIMHNVEVLKKELALAEAGVKYLDNRVDEDIVWVHSHCEIPAGTNAMSVRTVGRCRKLAVEKIVMVFSGYAQNTLLWALVKWRESSNYDRLKVITSVYSRAKGIELLCKVTHGAVCRQLLKAWVPWLKGVKAQKRAERNAAATEICRIVRGYLARKTAKNLLFFKAAATIQRMVKKFLSRKISFHQQQRLASGEGKPQRRPIEDESMESAVESPRHKTQGEVKEEREERRRIYAIERAALRADAAARDGESLRELQSKEASSEAKGSSFRVKRNSTASAKQSFRQEQAMTPKDQPFTTNIRTEAELGRESVEVGAARVRERNKLLQDKERERAKKKQAKEDAARIHLEKKDEIDHSMSSAAVTIQRVVRGMLAGTLGSQEVTVEAARNLGTDTESVSTALLKKKSGSNSKLSSADNSVMSNRSRSNSNSSSSSGASKRKSFTGLNDPPPSQSTTPDDAKTSFFPNIVEKISTKKLSDVREEEIVPSPEGREFDPEMSSEKVGGETEGNKGSDRGSDRSDMENGTAEERERRIRRVLSDSSKEDNMSTQRKGCKIDVIPSPSHHKSPNSTSKIQLKSGLRSRSQRRSLPSLAGHKNSIITNTKKPVRNDPASINSILDISHTNGRGKPDILEREPRDTFNSISANSSSKRNSLSHELKTRKKSVSCTGEFSTPHTLGIPYSRNGLGRPYSTNTLKILPSNLPPVPSPKFVKSSKFVHSIRSMTPPAPLGMVEDESPESVDGKKRVMSPNTVNSMDVELTNAPHTFDSNITPITDLSCFMGGCETTSASLNTMDTLTPGCGYIALHTQSSTATMTTEQFRAQDRDYRMSQIELSVSDASGSQNPESSQETDRERNETPRRLEEFKHKGREEVEVEEPDSESIMHDEPDTTVDAAPFTIAEYVPSRLDNSSSSSANSSPRSISHQQARTENENSSSCVQAPSSSRRQSEADAADAARELEEDRQREEDEEKERERERVEDLRQRDEAAARQREEEEEEERRKNEAEKEAEKERERIKALKLRIEASAAARRKEKEEADEKERERERLEDLRQQEKALTAARQREEEEDRLRMEEEEKERERERLEDLRQRELAAVAARQREEDELREEEDERIRREEEQEAEKERERKRDLKQRMEASIAARRREKEEEERRRKIEEMEEIQREHDRMEALQRRDEASLKARQGEEEEIERERARVEDLRRREFESIAARKREEDEEEQKKKVEGGRGEALLESQRVEDLRQRELASIAARRREEEREREIIEDQRIRERISENKLNLAKAQELERERLREAERLREEALKAQKEKGNFGIVKGIAAILKQDKSKNAADKDKDCDKDKSAEIMPTKNASEINEEDVMLLAKQLSYSKVLPNRSRRVSASRVAGPKNPTLQSLEGSVRRPAPPDDGNPGRPRPPEDIVGRRRPSDDASLKKYYLSEEPVNVRARIRSEDSLPSMSKPPLHSDDCSSIGSRRRRSSSISPLVKNSPKPSTGESAVDEKIRLLDEKLQKLEAVEKRVEERERAMEIARKVTENKALALEIRMLEFEERCVEMSSTTLLSLSNCYSISSRFILHYLNSPILIPC